MVAVVLSYARLFIDLALVLQAAMWESYWWLHARDEEMEAHKGYLPVVSE